MDEIIAAASGTGSAATNAACTDSITTTMVQEVSVVAAAFTTSVIVADSAQVQTTSDSVLFRRQFVGPLPRLIVDSFTETHSTISLPSDPPNEGQCDNPTSSGEAESAVDQILSASPWRRNGNHARKVHVLAYENASTTNRI